MKNLSLRVFPLPCLKSTLRGAWLAAVALAWGASCLAVPMPVIFDTDMDSDVGDLTALAVLHAMMDEGEVELLAVMISGKNELSAPCVDVLNTFYGRPDLPIAVVARTDLSERQESDFAQKLLDVFPEDFRTKRDFIFANDLYREILGKAADGSVTIIGVGELTNLAALLDSRPDQFSPLAGPDLVKAKVRQYVCMVSRLPADTEQGTGKMTNFRSDVESARAVLENWPTMITFTGGGKFGESMSIGSRITLLDSEKWPLGLAYRAFFKDDVAGKKRHVADSLAVLIGVRGIEPYFQVVDQGSFELDDLGRNTWVAEPDVENRQYVNALKNSQDAKKIADMIEDLATRPSKLAPPF